MPIEKAAATVSAVTGLADIQAENARLRAENQKLHEWMQAAQILDKENSSLRTLLNFQDNQKFHYTASFVIADSNNAYANSVLLKTGSKNGVTKGQPVINTDGLIGRIVATGNTTSRVLLLNDINSRVPVLIQGLDVKAIMAGSKTGNPIIKRVEDKEASLSNELSVITSGHGGILPYGLPVGKLKKIEDGLFEVVLHADLDNLHYVRVIDSSSSPSILEELQ
jgi:rod shape-determining protein MreC